MSEHNANVTDPLDRDRLYVALTRPPMVLGVTDVFMVFFMIIEMTIFIGVSGGRGLLYSFFMAFPLYFAGYIACAVDPRIFDIFITKTRFFSRAQRLNSYWGGPSLSPN